MEGIQWERFVDKKRNTLHSCFHSIDRFLSLSVCRLLFLFRSLSPVFSVFGSRSLSFYLSYIQSIASQSASVPGIRCAITLLQIDTHPLGGFAEGCYGEEVRGMIRFIPP